MKSAPYIYKVNFYPRPPCGGRPSRQGFLLCPFSFLSTSPLRGTTHAKPHNGGQRRISIHVPLAGDDKATSWRLTPARNFYPRPPCGGRPAGQQIDFCRMLFLSTSPLRGTTGNLANGRQQIIISIHVPLAGDDALSLMPLASPDIFLSTSPLRGTTFSSTALRAWTVFLSTSPLRGTTPFDGGGVSPVLISIHVPLAGDDIGGCGLVRPELISIHVPLAGDDGKVQVRIPGRGIFLSTSPLRGTTLPYFTPFAATKFLSTSPLRGTTWRTLPASC